MRVAYADPPYPGCAHLYPEQREVDHAELIGRLVAEFPDGWALSTSSVALRTVLPLCPETVRVMAWVKPFAVFRPNVFPAYAWEPVLVCGGRRPGRGAPTLRDWVADAATPARISRTIGTKPLRFCFWLFGVLGLKDGDELVDLFPGSGGVVQAWEMYRRQRPLAFLVGDRETTTAPISRIAMASVPTHAEPRTDSSAGCEACGAEMARTKPWRRFCSPRCRRVAWDRAHPRTTAAAPPA
jgi:hypothetical protein